MTRDSIVFGVYVDGVCAVGCDRPKVLAAMKAVKATLDATGLQCSEIEADTSRQVFTGHQLDHESGKLSLEDSRIWRLRHGLEFAACQKHLAGDQVAKFIGHITWGCLLRRPALSLINAGYRFARTFGPRSGRLWLAVAHEFKWIASLLPLLTCNLASPWSPWVYATDASGGAHGGFGVTRRWRDPVDAAATGSCGERWRFPAEEFISARRSALVELELEAQKTSWLGVEDIREAGRVDLHPRWVGDMRESFHAMPDDRAVFENIPSTILQPKSAWCILFGGVWRKPLEILRGEGKAYVMGLRHACRSTESLRKTVTVLAGQLGLGTGCFKGPR